MRQVQQVRKFV